MAQHNTRKELARLTVLCVPDLTPEERRSMADWLREAAKMIEVSPAEIPMTYNMRYLVPSVKNDAPRTP